MRFVSGGTQASMFAPGTGLLVLATSGFGASVLSLKLGGRYMPIGQLFSGGAMSSSPDAVGSASAKADRKTAIAFLMRLV